MTQPIVFRLMAVIAAASGLLGCDPEPPVEGPLFEGVVQLRDVATRGDRIFLANDVASALTAPPGSIDPTRLHDMIVLAPAGAAYAVEGVFDAPALPTRGFSRRIVVDATRDRAYLALGAGPGEGFVQIVDIADPSQPVPLHQLSLPALVSGIGAEGDLLAVASPDALRLFDVSDPTAPVPRGSFTPLDNAGLADVVVHGGRAFVAATGGATEPLFLYPRLLVVDVSDPGTPALLGEARIESGFQGLGLSVVIRGVHALLLGDVGLAVFDVSDPGAIAFLGGVPTTPTLLPALYTDVAWLGDVAFVTTRGDGLRAIDLGDPSNAFVRTTLPGTSASGSVAAAIALGAGQAFVALSRTGLRAVSIDGDRDDVASLVDVCPGVADPAQDDADLDASGDACDVCTFEPDFDQADADGDGFGNRCDPDLDGDGVVNFRDLARLKSAFFSNDPVADLDLDGVVNFSDLSRLKQRFFQPPGPSAASPQP